MEMFQRHDAFGDNAGNYQLRNYKSFHGKHCAMYNKLYGSENHLVEVRNSQVFVLNNKFFSKNS